MSQSCRETCSGPLYCWYVLVICVLGSAVCGFIVGASIA